ncbi:MAG: biotin/lipoyl-binding protein, partial [Chitinophagaceae bacterium]
MPELLKPPAKKNIHLRSTTVQEFISHKPDFYVRWGISIFGILILLTVIVCWFIKYPEVVQSRGMLVSINPPKQIISHADGKLTSLFASEGEMVKKGQAIGFIESTADHNQVLLLARRLDHVMLLLADKKLSDIPRFIETDYNNIGELQMSYQSFIQSYVIFKGYLPGGIFSKKLSIIGKELNNLSEMQKNIVIQKELQVKDLSLFEQTFDVNKQLNKEQHFSDMDLRNEESRLIGKQLGLPQVNA